MMRLNTLKMNELVKNSLLVGKRNGMLSIIGNIILFGIKLWAGIVSGSVALIADAWHTLTDSFSSLIMLIGFRISSKPADDDHPFGHGRAEVISSLIIGILLVLVGFNFLYESVNKYLSKDIANFGTIAIVVTILSVVVKEAMAQYAFWAARKTGFKSLKADGWHHRSDAISSVIILAGIFLSSKLWWIDSVLGLLVALIIGYTGGKIFRETFLMLLGQTPDKKMKQKIILLSEKIAGADLRHHHFHVHSYGNHTEITFHIKLPGNMQLAESHEITKKLTRAIEEEMNIFATIYVDAY
jgi:cation diffusion facilitator family transporter